MKLFKRKHGLGIVLSGGAARGIAHLGVLEALDEQNKKIDIISGSSAGALAGAFYMDGYHPHEILEFFTNKSLFELLRFSIPKSGFLRTDGLKKLLKKNLKTKHIEDLEKPLIVAATNFKEGKIEYFKKGVLVDCLLASSGIPILFEVTNIDSIPYIDGGIMDNFPIQPLEGQCKKIYGVHVNPLSNNEDVRHPFQVAERAFHLAIASDIHRKQQQIDLFIEPQKLTLYGLLELKKAKEIYQIGYEAATEILNSKSS